MTTHATLLKRIKKRERFRKLGKLKFSIYGGLLMGFLFAVLTPFINWLFFANEYDFKSLIKEYLAFHPLYAALFYGLFWFLFDYIYYWNQMEKQYQKWINERDREANQA